MSSGNAQFSSTGSEVESPTRSVYVASGFPASPDYRVAARIYFHTTTSNTFNYTFVAGRMDETAHTMYMFGFVYVGVNRWELKKFVNGSESLLASSTQSLPSPGDSPLVDLRMEGSTIKGFGRIPTSRRSAGSVFACRPGARRLRRWPTSRPRRWTSLRRLLLRWRIRRPT
jgi:hypothetical protein